MTIQQQVERLIRQPHIAGTVRAAALLALLGIVITAAGGPGALPDAFRRLRGMAYSAARNIQQDRTLRSVEGWDREESGLVRLYYSDADGDIAGTVAAYADEAYSAIRRRLGYDTPRRLNVIMYPSFESLQQSVPGGDSGRSVGVCWAGVVGIVSPKAWGDAFGPGGQLELFGRYNPLHHEITHYVLDEMTSGNCPRWFSEGLAQVEEYSTTGYVWEDPATGSTGPGSDLSLRALEREFQREDTLNAAYLKSMWAAGRIMEGLDGPGFARFTALLRQGSGFEAALRGITRLDYGGIESEWRDLQRAGASPLGRIVAGPRGKNPAEG
ncbi:MAG: hypothetical protein ACM3X4_03380 [Ignavibacteriales bacterium]